MTGLEERESRIQNWITEVLSGGGIDQYDDLHLNQIDGEWAGKEHWLQGGLEAYRIAVRLRNSQAPNLKVVLAYSLNTSEIPQGVNFGTTEALQSQLDWSPPSLYLFHRGREPWTQPVDKAVCLNAESLFGSPLESVECYYVEFKQPGSSEYLRSVFLAG
jgi:hypothetical protein